MDCGLSRLIACAPLSHDFRHALQVGGITCIEVLSALGEHDATTFGKGLVAFAKSKGGNDAPKAVLTLESDAEGCSLLLQLLRACAKRMENEKRGRHSAGLARLRSDPKGRRDAS